MLVSELHIKLLTDELFLKTFPCLHPASLLLSKLLPLLREQMGVLSKGYSSDASKS